MDIEFDGAKDEANIAKHGVSLTLAAELEIRAVKKDDRQDYGEVRYQAWGLIGGLPYFMVFTLRGAVVRVIGLRRCHQEEFDRHAS